MNPSAIPAELRALPQWVRYKLVPDEPKPRKIPVRPSDPDCASSTDPATWGTFEDALSQVGQHGTCGVGFVFSEDYFGMDLDGCLTEEGIPDAKAAALVEGFATYTEISPSGTGLHVIGKGSLNGHRGMNRGGVELYDRGRYFTMTGNALPGAPPTIAECQMALDALVAKLDPPKPPPPPMSPRPRRSDDHERLVERARAYVAKMPAAISGQGGHEATFRVALALAKGFSLDTGMALDLLRDFNARCEPPWSEKELEHKIADADKADVPDGYILERDEPKAQRSAPVPASQTNTTGAETKDEAGTDTPDSRRLITTTMLFDEYLARKTALVPCALAGLNKALGGGWETRRNHLVTTQAGGGKTGFLLQNAAYGVLHEDVYAVVALKDGDQWSDGLRLAQMAGVDRFELRDRIPEAVEAAREAMARYADRLMVYDVSKPGATFLDMAERALRWVDGRGRLFIGTDSIHVFPSADQAKERAMQIYDRIAVRLETIHDFVVANDAVGLTVGQSGRAAYSRKRDEENADPLAAISGGHIAENTVDVLIVITKPNESGTRFILVPKSRLGGQGSRIPARYDEERSLWLDVEAVIEEAAPKESRTKAKQAAKDEEERKAREAIGLLFRRSPAGLTAEEVRKASGRRAEWVASVIDELHAHGDIELGIRPGLDSRGRKIKTSVWIWNAEVTT